MTDNDQMSLEPAAATRAVATTNQDATPLAMIMAAIESKADPSYLSKLMDLQERVEKREAERAYNAAMIEVQSRLPGVCSNATNPQTNSDYPTETRVRQTIQAMCLDHGFTFTVDEATAPVDDVVCVRLTVRHVNGHESTMLRYGKVDMYGPKGNPNSTHVQGCQKTVTYLGRRMLLQAFGVVVDGDDKDGGAPAATISEEQAITIGDMVDALPEGSLAGFKKWLTASVGADGVHSIPAARYGEVHAALKRKLGSKP